MAEYRRPFAEPGEGRRPALTWPREIPIEGEPADVAAIAADYADWLGTSNVPRLFLKAEPGAILANYTLINLVRRWPALTENRMSGIHFVQEDSPDEIGRVSPAGWERWADEALQDHDGVASPLTKEAAKPPGWRLPFQTKGVGVRFQSLSVPTNR